MKIIGLTGGIGSGKSAAATRFEALDVPVIDADKVGHDVLTPGGAAEKAVIETFGEQILSGGQIDRDKLGQQVFGNDQMLKKLNEIVHPSITAEIGRRCAALAIKDTPYVIIEATLIGENTQRDAWLDGLILVSAPLEQRLSRLFDKRGMTEEDALKRVDAQTDPESKRSIADWTLDNSGTLDHLHCQVDMLAQDLLESTL